MRQSKLTLQDKLIDCHTHCEGLDIYNYLNYLTPTTLDVFSLSDIISRSHVDFAITFPIQSSVYYTPQSYLNNLETFKPLGTCSFPYEVENLRMLLGIRNRSINNLLPFLTFSLNDKVNEQIDAIEKLLLDYDIYGLKYHSQTDRCYVDSIDNYPKLLDLILKNNLPILFHAGKSKIADPCKILDFAEKHHDIRVCIAHFARFQKEFFQRYSYYEYDNVFLDIAPFDYLFETIDKPIDIGLEFLNGITQKKELLYTIVKEYPTRILWGTDYPWINPVNLFEKSNLAEKITNYTQVVDTLLSLDVHLIQQISNKNTLEFLFG